MQTRTDAPGTTHAAASPAEAAQRAATLDAALRRVAELERIIGQERAQNAARAKEVEAGVAVLRKTVHDIQGELRRSREENLRLHEQVDQSRRLLAEMTADDDPDAPSTTGLELALESARSEIAALREEVVRARREADALRDRVHLAEAGRAGHPAPAEGDAEPEPEASVPADDAPTPAPSDASPVAARAAEPASRPARPGPSVALHAEDELLTDDSVSVAVEPLADATEPPAEWSAGAPGPAADEAAPELQEAGGADPALAAPTVATLQAASARNEAARAPSAEPVHDPRFPQINGVSIERLVDEGPAGLVFEAREVASRRAVQVRLLPRSLRPADGKRLDSVLLAKHPNLVSVLNYAVCRQGPFLVLEREEGETAGDWVKRIGVLPEKIALTVALEAARGLRQAAFHGALHGDLSPRAVLIDAAGRVRIRGVGLRSVLTQGDDRPVVPEFASPERLRGSPPPDARSDLYSLGAILHFLLTGKPPYEGDRDSILRSQAAGAVPDLRELRSGVSDDTAKFVRRLLSTDPDLRPQTWDQILVELERRVPGRVSTALRGNLSTRVRRFLVANPWVLGAAVGALLLVAGIWRVLGSGDPSASEKFREACVTAEKLAGSGDVQGARNVYRRFLTGTGDSDVEREAARRFDSLK